MMNPNMAGIRPQIILLRDGTDTSQGKGQLISNINACQAVAEAVRTTLGPRGMDKLIVSEQGKVRSHAWVRCVCPLLPPFLPTAFVPVVTLQFLLWATSAPFFVINFVSVCLTW